MTNSMEWMHLFFFFTIIMCVIACNDDLIGQWTFEEGEELKDLTGNFGNIALRKAVVENGQLDLGRDKWAVAGSYTGPTIYEKTLVSWVSIDSFSIQKGSVLTIDKVSKHQFDAIVLGERIKNHWMAGSSYFHRTVDPKPGFEEKQLNVMVQLAISYENEKGKAHIRLYRNGEKFGDYIKGSIANWAKGDAEVIWGIRHGNANRNGGPDNMDAHIEESRIYARVLTSDDLKKLSPKAHKSLLGHWTFEKGEETKDLTGNFCHIKLKGAVVENGQLDLGQGKWAVAGDYIGPTIYEKTLVSWVSIDSFSIQKGSVLTIDKVSTHQFDAIVLGELIKNHWMAGSSYHHRTEDPKPGFEEKKLNVMVQLAISYENENGKAHIRLYRNGEKFGDYIKGSIVNWAKGDAEVIWGIRHGNANRNGGPDNMDAHIEESRIYAGVLTSDDLKKLTPMKTYIEEASEDIIINNAANEEFDDYYT